MGIGPLKEMFDNMFAPVTDEIGFVEEDVERVLQAYRDKTSKVYPDQEVVRCSRFEDALFQMEPLNSPRILFAHTKSSWTAILQNKGRLEGDVRYFFHHFDVRAMYVHYVKDAYDTSGQMGGVVFSYCCNPPDQWRAVSVINENGHWRFGHAGPLQEFEEPERYRLKKKTERFTAEMLDSYCHALGIDFFNEDFYGPDCVLIKDEGDWYSGNLGPIMFDDYRKNTTEHD